LEATHDSHPRIHTSAEEALLRVELPMLRLHMPVEVIFSCVAPPEATAANLLAEKHALTLFLVRQALALMADEILFQREGLRAIPERAREDDLVVRRLATSGKAWLGTRPGSVKAEERTYVHFWGQAVCLPCRDHHCPAVALILQKCRHLNQSHHFLILVAWVSCSWALY
jgi:hypothetical protein